LAKDAGWNGGRQLEKRFSRYRLQKDTGIKCDFAVKGDSFARHNEDYLRQYTKEMYDFLNNSRSATLKEAKDRQNEAKDKCVTYKIETRPDQIDEKKCRLFVELGITTVEIGVQSLDDSVLAYNKRGHDTASVRKTTQLLRQFGFEVVYQMMVGLPGSCRETDKKGLTETLWRDEYAPDAIKIYPCLLLKDRYVQQNRLRTLFKKGLWRPYTTEEYIHLLKACYPDIPGYVHINRIQRIISPEKIAAGVAEEIDRKIFSEVSNCLWQRSINNCTDDWNIRPNNCTISSRSQGTHRYCFEALVGSRMVTGYGRLDFLSKKAAIIRDLRVLGDMLPVGTKNVQKTGCQHIGTGTALLKAMEDRAKDEQIDFIFIKPSFGAAKWFIERGYRHINEYYLAKYPDFGKSDAIEQFHFLVSDRPINGS
jgi:elongator complex protein 3